jgi:hypothetical protein
MSEFRAIQQRLGEDGDLDYYNLWRLMRERQETLSLSSLLQNSLHELPQASQSVHIIRLLSLLRFCPACFHSSSYPVSAFYTSLFGILNAHS